MAVIDIDLQIVANRLPAANSFFDRPQVDFHIIPIGPGVPLGIEHVSNPALGIGGAYGAWGDCYDNAALPGFVENILGAPLPLEARLRLDELGFVCRHHLPPLSHEEHIALEIEVGARFLAAAMEANGWEPSEIAGVLVGSTVPAVEDYAERIAAAAGIPESAIKADIHKACDGSVAGLQLALNLDVPASVAGRLYGKKVLVAGIEGLSRVIAEARDAQAMQLFGTAAGAIGVIPGVTMSFLAGAIDEVYDEQGLLQVRMFYPHSRQHANGNSRVEVVHRSVNSLSVSGMLHEPPEEAGPVIMGHGGLVKFFVRNGVPPVRKVYAAYRELMERRGTPDRDIALAVVHHANLKINQLKAKTLWDQGICLPMPWLLNEFGNVSAASNMIAFLRALPSLQPADHVLFDGFGAGTYYDVLAVELAA